MCWSCFPFFNSLRFKSLPRKDSEFSETSTDILSIDETISTPFRRLPTEPYTRVHLRKKDQRTELNSIGEESATRDNRSHPVLLLGRSVTSIVRGGNVRHLQIDEEDKIDRSYVKVTLSKEIE
ncbi:unnamed protein product [Dimorphilus gyrociliatus]|uniref:Uncharacterized protein n=1 Tax=Dimorphilus gyrociliatus TaxID=2664684 RepID=A0A7I8VF97_9ANNE|nr:unnamed protein product [Dimorphilus gyrociliatus]